MFRIERRETKATAALSLGELIFHATVRHIRKGYGSGLMALAMSVLQTVIFIAAFYVLFSVLGLRGSAIRGDFTLYLMTGVFLFLTHTKAMSAVVAAEGPASPMMKHAPMNTAIAIAAAALGSLYIQTLSMVLVLFGAHVLMAPLTFDDVAGAGMMFLLSWFTGVGIGLCLLAVKPWFPNAVKIAASVYARLNMVASGKMFTANALPGYLLPWFTWNPLFHAIDQSRGFTFVNYNPHFTSWTYPLTVGVALLMLGLMGEFYTRRRASLSWFAGR